jgi:hypothetical protein
LSRFYCYHQAGPLPPADFGARPAAVPLHADDEGAAAAAPLSTTADAEEKSPHLFGAAAPVAEEARSGSGRFGTRYRSADPRFGALPPAPAAAASYYFDAPAAASRFGGFVAASSSTSTSTAGSRFGAPAAAPPFGEETLSSSSSSGNSGSSSSSTATSTSRVGGPVAAPFFDFDGTAGGTTAESHFGQP